MNSFLVIVCSLFSHLWAKPQIYDGYNTNVDTNSGYGSPDSYNNYNNYQQQQPGVCYDMQEKRIGQFVFVCRSNNFEPNACLSQQGLGQVQLGATQVEGNFLMQCYSPRQGQIGYKPVACIFNGQTYMPGQYFRLQQYGSGGLDAYTLGMCFLDEEGMRIKPAGCIDDYGRKYYRTSNLKIRGQNAQCIVDPSTKQIMIQLMGTYGGSNYGGGNYGSGSTNYPGGSYGGGSGIYGGNNYNQQTDPGYGVPSFNLRKE